MADKPSAVSPILQVTHSFTDLFQHSLSTFLCQAWRKALGITMIKTNPSRSSQSNGKLLSKLRHGVVSDLPSEVELARYLEMGD